MKTNFIPAVLLCMHLSRFYRTRRIPLPSPSFSKIFKLWVSMMKIRSPNLPFLVSMTWLRTHRKTRLLCLEPNWKLHVLNWLTMRQQPHLNDFLMPVHLRNITAVMAFHGPTRLPLTCFLRLTHYPLKFQSQYLPYVFPLRLHLSNQQPKTQSSLRVSPMLFTC